MMHNDLLQEIPSMKRKLHEMEIHKNKMKELIADALENENTDDPIIHKLFKKKVSTSGSGKGPKSKCCIDGVDYGSLSIAGRKFGICRTVVRYRCHIKK